MAKKVKIDAWQKYQNPLLTQYNIEQLAELKRSNWSGLLLGIDQLYSTMYHEWDALQKDCNDIAAAVRSLEWTVVPKVNDGEVADERAQEVCQVVQDALWQRARVPLGGYSHSFLQLVEAMVHAVFRGFNVHQIEWANDGELVYPARYVQLYPQFLVWETQSGKPDRLLLVPDGSGASGVPFDEGQFVVALNNNGPDHPVYNATFYSLVNWFLAYKFGLAWFMQFTQKYGMPKQVFQYASEKDREQLIRDMEDERVINALFLKGDRKYELVNPPAGGASLPQAVLIQKAEEACHKAILGQTLTSDTSSHGGSLAQAKVHAGVRAELVLHHAEFVAEVLNQQLIPAIVRANFGKTEGVPMPELRCKLPGARQNVEVLNFWKMVMDMGIPFKKSEFHDSTGIAMPGEGDEVYGGEPQGGMPGMPGMPEQEVPEGADAAEQDDDDDDDDDPEPPGGGGRGDSVEAARAARRDAAQAWLAPLKERLREARARGASLAEIAKEAREWRLDTVSLAADMAVNVQRGLMGGVDAVQAGHCNQYQHEEGCPHEGAGLEAELERSLEKLVKLGYKDKKNFLEALKLTARVIKSSRKEVEDAASDEERKAAQEGLDYMLEYGQELLKDAKDAAAGLENSNERKKLYFEPAETPEQAKKNTASLIGGVEDAVQWSEDMPLDYINEFNETVAEMMEKYPINGDIAMLGDYVDEYDSAAASCAQGTKTDSKGEAVHFVYLRLNRDNQYGGIFAMKNEQMYTAKQIEETGGFTRGNVGASDSGVSVRSVMLHEYGHAILSWVQNRVDDRTRWNYKLPELVEARKAQVVITEAFEQAKASGDIKKISKYAESDYEEFFVECFAARELGENLPDYVNSALDNIIKLGTKKA